MLDNLQCRWLRTCVLVAGGWLFLGVTSFASAESTRAALRGTDCNMNGVSDDVDISAGISQDCNSNSLPDECDISGAVVYVDGDAAGAGTGDNWTDALTDLQVALCMADQPALGITEIRVAEGTYRPAGSNGLRIATFQLVNNVALYGGYAGTGQPDPNHRDPKVHETILSGDLAGNDVGTNGRDENSYHVVTASGTAATAILDGFTVARGNADGIGSDANGGGIYALAGAATIRNCHITSNGAANEGGGVFGSTGKISKCHVSANRAYKGAGLYNCAHISHSYIVRNGVWLDSAGDTYTGGGLGACNQVYNSVISGNAAQYGGGLHQPGFLINCTIAGNAAQSGSGMEVKIGTRTQNTVIWPDSLTGPLAPDTEFVRCVLPFPLGGASFGNISTDPLYRDPLGMDGAFGTTDDDLRFMPTSPAIDAGRSSYVPADVTDVDGDGDVTERIPLDLDGSPRFVDDPLAPNTGIPSPGYPVVDIGAFEYYDCNSNGAFDPTDILGGTSLDCNMNSVPDECEVTDVSRDCNMNGYLDECDIRLGSSSDCDSNNVPDECYPDCNTNGTPDTCDIHAGTSADCNANVIPDECDLLTHPDCNTNGIPDDCELDCDANSIPDTCDILVGTSPDCNANGIPDLCEYDCDNNGTPDDCDIASDRAYDCNTNGTLDQCELSIGSASEVSILIGNDTAGGDSFGDYIAMSGDTLLISSVFDDDAGPTSGSTYVFRRLGETWEQVAKLTASDAEAGDAFGRGLSLDGRTAIIGAASDDDWGTSSGSAYVFREVNGVWQQVAKVAASDGAADDRFGTSVAISGNTAAIGAYQDDDRGTNSGSVYVFREMSGQWLQIAKLTASDGAPNDSFGSSVAMSGGIIVVGAPLDDHVGVNCGSVYVFEEVGGAWQQHAKLIPGDSGSGEAFGSDIALNGTTLLVGAPDDNVVGTSSGSAYLFRKTGAVWQQRAKLLANDSTAFDRFGSSIAISGNTVGIGVAGDDDFGVKSGAVYLFYFDDYAWTQTTKLYASDAADNDFFGASIATSGYSIVVGATGRDALGGASGGAYMFVDSALALVDCNENFVFDECEPDCNSNSMPDVCEIRAGTAADCDINGVPDECDLATDPNVDCNADGSLDACEVAAGTSSDCDVNGVPDECDLQAGMNVDCNINGMLDVCEIAGGTAPDCDMNGIVDECDLSSGTSSDCNTNEVPDSCDVMEDNASDCNVNLKPDECDIVYGTSMDCNSNGSPDECDLDCNDNGMVDDCEVAFGTAEDCNSNGVPDACDIRGGLPEEQANLVASDAASFDQAGFSVSVDGATALVGAPFDDDGGNSAGSAYVYRRVAGAWQQIAKLNAPDPSSGDNFGRSVSLSGNTALIGSHLDDDLGVDSGAAYVYREVGGAWMMIAKLKAADAGSTDLFGYSVALSGNTAVIGAIQDDVGVTNSGSVYIFRETGGTWLQAAKLTASDGGNNDWFGSSVAISGSTMIIGAYSDDNVGTDSGSAYVFQELGGNWQQQAKLTANDAASLDQFGFSVSISGGAAIVGSYADDDNGSASGSAYVFRDINSTWQQVTKLKAGDSAAGDRFGYSVAIVNDTAWIGANGDDDAGSDTGSAYMFQNSNGIWTQVEKFAASDAAAGDRFGSSIAASSTGVAMIVGAHLNDGPATDNGSAYVFVSGVTSLTDCNENGRLDGCEVAENDCNSNSVPDDCDPDLDGDAIPDDCDPCAAGQASGDADGDGSVGLDDYASLERCLLGLSPSQGPGCECFDFDASGAVDLLDFAEFQIGFTIAGGG